MLRPLLYGEKQTAGKHALQWDGLDRDGKPAPAGKYTWKLLETQGFKTQYLLTLGTSVPRGPEWWHNGVGNHIGVTSLAVDPTGVYFGAGSAENVTSYAKFTSDLGRRLWSGWQPDVSDGGFSMDAMDSRLYQLTQEARIAVTSVDAPAPGGQAAPQWDVLWAGEKRPPAGEHISYINPYMDMAARKVPKTGPQLIVSYFTHDTVRWLNPAKGTVLDTATVEKPKGVAIDNDGRFLVISGQSIVQLTRERKEPQVVVKNLVEPWRLTVDPKTNDILVVELGASQQIKRFSAAGKLLAAYGRKGGRKFGLYKAEDFRGVNDIAADGSGGFWICEPYASPRRAAHFDRSGKLLREWYTGTVWTPNVVVDPEDPAIVWVEINHGELTRCIVNYDNRTWSVHSTYDISGLANGTLSPVKGFSGGGYNGWSIRRRGGQTYLVRNRFIQILKLDTKNWSLKACVAASYGEGGNAGGAFIWTDSNDDGIPQKNEYRRYGKWGLYGWQRESLDSPAGFDYYRCSSSDGKTYKISPTRFDASGTPIYPDLTVEQVFAEPVPGFAMVKYYENPPTIFASGPDGALYAALQQNAGGWSMSANPMLVKWNSAGKLQWRVGQHATCARRHATRRPDPLLQAHGECGQRLRDRQ